MEGNCLNIGDWEGKGKAASFEYQPCPNASEIILEEGKGSENKDAKGKEIAVDPSLDSQVNVTRDQPSFAVVREIGVDQVTPPPDVASFSSPSRVDLNQENIPKDQPSFVAALDPGSLDCVTEVAAVAIVSSPPKEAYQEPPRVAVQDPLVPQMDDRCRDERPSMRRTYPCKYCPKQFPTAQALGGHQNCHKLEREHVKRQKMSGHMPYHFSSFVDTHVYPDYHPFSYKASLGLPQIPLGNYTNNITLDLPPPGYPYSSMSFSHHTQYPWPTTGLTLGQFSQSFNMWSNNKQLSAYDRLRMTEPYPGNINSNNTHTNIGDLNSAGIVGGGEGGMLEGFQSVNGNTSCSGSDKINPLGKDGLGEGGRMTQGSHMVNENTNFSPSGFETGGSSSSVTRNFSGFSQGESDVTHQFQNDVCDGTIDLLSQFGKDSGEDAFGD